MTRDCHVTRPRQQTGHNGGHRSVANFDTQIQALAPDRSTPDSTLKCGSRHNFLGNDNFSSGVWSLTVCVWKVKILGGLPPADRDTRRKEARRADCWYQAALRTPARCSGYSELDSDSFTGQHPSHREAWMWHGSTILTHRNQAAGCTAYIRNKVSSTEYSEVSLKRLNCCRSLCIFVRHLSTGGRQGQAGLGPDNDKWRQTPSVAVGVSTTTWTQHLLTDLVTHIHEYRPVV